MMQAPLVQPNLKVNMVMVEQLEVMVYQVSETRMAQLG
jgi:hypothetical protein